MNDWLWLIPVSPLIGALLLAVFGAPLRRVAGYIATLAVAVSFGVVIAVWWQGVATPWQQTLYTWLHVSDWQASFGLRVDRITLVMISVASGIGLLIHLFSIRFMQGDYGESRYFFYLNLFVAGMLLLTMADNLLFLYLGWETVGLCSYALVAHWYREAVNAWSGRKAFVVTRIGDTALALAIFFIFAHYQTLSFDVLFSSVENTPVDTSLLILILLLILIAAVGKSAQLPLSVWLPDAMTGPSTVSALIHAATMVTAGVYLIIRLHPLYDLLPAMRTVVALVGAVTLIYAACAGLAQYDIKRVLAYSTISQIGYMFLGAGIGAYGLALFHLLVHACFKSLLFMASGVVIRIYEDDHDIRHMGGLARQQPLLNGIYLAGALSLAAAPLVSAGFYSKDAIITSAWAAPQLGWLLWGLGTVGAVLTGMYTFRLYLLIFYGKPVKTPGAYRMPVSMAIPLLLLAVLSIAIGWIQFPQGWPAPHLWLPWLTPQLGDSPAPATSIAQWLLLTGALTSLLGIVLAFPVVIQWERQGRGLADVRFLMRGWYLDTLYDWCVVRPYFMLARLLRLVPEQGLLQGLGVDGIRWSIRAGSRLLLASENGYLARYAGVLILGAVLVVAYLF